MAILSVFLWYPPRKEKELHLLATAGCHLDHLCDTPQGPPYTGFCWPVHKHKLKQRELLNVHI